MNRLSIPLRAWSALLLWLLLLGAATGALAQKKPRIEKAADLPRFTYKVEGALDDIVRQAGRFAPLAAQIRRDTESVLNDYEIPDAATQRGLLNQLAVLDFLDGRYESALARAEQARGLQDKPADKLLSGLRLRVLSQAAMAHGRTGGAYQKAVAENIARELAGMPYSVIANEIRELKASAEIIGEALILGSVREVLQPMAKASGELSSEFISGLVFSRYALLAVLPLKQTLIDSFGGYLAANKVVKADIWAARDVVLTAADGGKPVRLAVWDSGVDLPLFPKQVLRNTKGDPAFIAFDKYSRRATTVLMPIPKNMQGSLTRMAAQTKGFSDLQSNIDSPEATEIKKLLSELAPEKYKDAIEELGLMGNYSHGTHVAGIALAGNPYARLVTARLEFNHKLKPEPCPSREGALRDAAAAQATVNYFKAQQVRVVNMSWGGDVNSVERDLEQCGIGKTPEERKALAREYFDIAKNALTKAFASAPKMLFVAAAGNSNNDPSFMEDIPAAIVLPNMLTVGAVDLAGDEASFTSYGASVKVHANGYQVDSFLPGGARVALSGTSMAAPQVANLAGKLLAVNPKLTPQQLVEVIVNTGERSEDGRRNLMHSQKALAAARKMR